MSKTKLYLCLSERVAGGIELHLGDAVPLLLCGGDLIRVGVDRWGKREKGLEIRG
jgi:hypothetical protein